VVLLRSIQLMLVHRFQELYFLIHYCCDYTRNDRALNACRRSGAPHVYWPHEKYKCYMKTPFSQLNLSGIEHV
jgi:hypothetical protein